jgi:hypothetical protein
MLPAVGLLCLNADVPHLGYFHDDSIYWVCARSLASGSGYRIASLPGEPYQTKYPPLYPWLLSLVWRLNDDFPANLRLAACLNLLVFPAYLLVVWRWFGDFGLNAPVRLILTMSLALSPYVAFFTVSLMPELIFAALLMASLILAACAERHKSGWLLAAGAGLLSGAAFLVKSAALPLLITGPLVFVLRKRYAAAGLFALSMLPAVAGWQTWVSTHGPCGGDEVILYYTSYLGHWDRFVAMRDWPRMIWMNLDYLVRAGGDLIAFRGSASPADLAFVYLLAAGALAGCCRLARKGMSLHALLFTAFYLAVLLNWNFRPNERLLFPVFPVLLAGLSVELTRVAAEIRKCRLRPGAAFRVQAAVAAGLLVAFLLTAVVKNGQALCGYLPELLKHRRTVTAEHRAAYRWVGRHLPADVNFIADYDVILHLYSGRKAFRLVLPFTPDYRGESRDMTRAVRSLPDFARAHRAAIYVSTAADFEPDLRRRPGFDPTPFLAEPVYRSAGVCISRIRRFRHNAISDCASTPLYSRFGRRFQATTVTTAKSGHHPAGYRNRAAPPINPTTINEPGTAAVCRLGRQA